MNALEVLDGTLTPEQQELLAKAELEEKVEAASEAAALSLQTLNTLDHEVATLRAAGINL